MLVHVFTDGTTVAGLVDRWWEFDPQGGAIQMTLRPVDEEAGDGAAASTTASCKKVKATRRRMDATGGNNVW
jgi:hypothetical protein